jgi:hypothetical protein
MRLGRLAVTDHDGESSSLPHFVLRQIEKIVEAGISLAKMHFARCILQSARSFSITSSSPLPGGSTMCWRNGLLVPAASCLTAFLLFATTALGGEHVRAATRPAVASPAAVRPASQTVSYSVTVQRAASPKPPTFVNLRGPDGKVRRFPLEGDIVVLPSGGQVALRPGRSITIWWVAAK